MKEYVGAEIALLGKVIKADSFAIPFGGRNPMWLGWWLKTLGKTVHSNDILHFSYMDAVGMIENDGVLLDDQAVAGLTEGLGRARPLENPELAKLVPMEDAYFFDQMRPRIERLSPRQKGIAIRAAYNTIRYAQMLDTSRLAGMKQPLAKVFAKQVQELNKRVTSSGEGYAYREEAGSFVEEVRAQVLYMQLPVPSGFGPDYASGSRPRGPLGREIFARGPSKNWLPELKAATRGSFGDRYPSREDYYKMVTRFLDRADDYGVWIFNVEESEYPHTLRAVTQFRRPKAVHRFDTREASGGYMSYFLIAER